MGTKRKEGTGEREAAGWELRGRGGGKRDSGMGTKRKGWELRGRDGN